MNQTPAHEFHNPDLLKFIPATSTQLIEVGCSSGALAREYKKINPACRYIGIDIDESYVKLAARYCDAAFAMNIDNADENFFSQNCMTDCWIFGDTLEHFQNPWGVLEKIRKVIPSNGSVVACIPNAQHWSLIARLCIGDFRYEKQGLLDKTHLRWFTRQTMIELFRDTGFKVVAGAPRIFNEPLRDRFLPIIGEMAKASGNNPDMAIEDALPLQYVLRAEPQ